MSYKCWVSRTSVAEVWVPYSVGLFEKKKVSACQHSSFWEPLPCFLDQLNTRKQEHFVAKIINEASLSLEFVRTISDVILNNIM